MELHTCRFLKFVVDDQLEPFAVINHAAVVEHVVVWEREVCRQQSLSYYHDVQNVDLRSDSFHLNHDQEILKMVATILAGNRKDAQAPQVCWIAPRKY